MTFDRESFKTLEISAADFADNVAKLQHTASFGTALLPRLGKTFAELLKVLFPPRQEIIRGLARGENGLLIAPTNTGKSTLLRNLVVALACGKPFPPFTAGGRPTRVILIDSEDIGGNLTADIKKMVKSLSADEQELVGQNLYIFCETEIGEAPVQLNRSDHFETLAAEIAAFKPGLIAIDTISRSFVIKDENHNAEVLHGIMKPLKRLATDTNAAVLAVHHIGKAKAEDGAARDAAHRGRGASSFADQSRVIFNLEKGNVDGRAVLSCPKIKGPRFDDHVLNLDADSRWFEVESASKMMTIYELIMDMFADGKMYRTSEVLERFKGRISERSVKVQLAVAVKHGDLKRTKRGFYQVADKQ